MKTASARSATGRPPAQRKAFTRLELLAALAGFFLLAFLALPLLGGIGPRSERIVCVNNLRLISRAYSLWAADNRGNLPWQSGPMHPLFQNPWLHWLAVSNQLGSPFILADPADRRMALRAAISWDNSAGTGFMNPNMRNNAISYWLGLKASPLLPNSVIATDRNLQINGLVGSSYGFTAAARITPEVAAWTNEVHGLEGNLAFMDGRVEQVGNAGLRQVIAWNTNWNHSYLPLR